MAQTLSSPKLLSKKEQQCVTLEEIELIAELIHSSQYGRKIVLAKMPHIGRCPICAEILNNLLLAETIFSR